MTISNWKSIFLKYSSFHFLWFVGVLRIISTDQICIYNIYITFNIPVTYMLTSPSLHMVPHAITIFKTTQFVTKTVKSSLWFMKLNSYTMLKTRCPHLRNSLWNPTILWWTCTFFGIWILVWKGIISQFPIV